MRIYYGWIIAIASLVLLTFVMGATFHSFSVFVVPVAEDLGLSRADANTGFILFSLGGAAWAPLMGKLMDRLPIRGVVLACAILVGASLAVLGVSHILWLSAAVLAVPLAIGVQGGVISATTLVARWFTVHRGRAMAIALFGMSLAGVLVTPTIAYGVEHTDWRQTLIVTGVVVTVVLIALAAIIREKPGPGDVESSTPQTAEAAAADASEPLKAIAILAMPQFWTLGVASAVTLAFTSAVMVTLVPLGLGAGADATQSAGLIAILSGAGFVGGLITAAIADRVDRMQLLAGLFIVVSAAGALFYFGHSFMLLVVATTLLGLSTGIVSPAFHALIADRFGARSFGTAYGLMSVLMTVFGALAVRFSGEVFDHTGSYDWLFLTIIAVEFVAAVLMFGTRVLGAPAAPTASATPR